MSEVKVNKISPRSGTDVTLGDSGDTFTIPSGATINNQGTAVNFGATGSASWVTTVKTSTFTAVAGEGYFVNTTGGAVTVNLPAGTAGAVVAVKDYANTFDSNAVTLNLNGSDKIGGSAVNATLSTEGLAVTLVFVDATQGWLVTDNGTQDTAPTAQYVTATGGTIATSACGNFKTHIFTGPGTFTVCSVGNATGSDSVDYFVVAGGGSGGFNSAGGGGGAGGFRVSNSYSIPSPTMSPLANPTTIPISVQGYPITVGAGASNPNPGTACQGSPTTFSTITSTGGGFGINTTNQAGGAGGSGGAALGGPTGTSGFPGGAGNTPPVSPPQGNTGGAGYDGVSTNTQGGGGGGAGAVGGNASSGAGGIGGAGSFIADGFVGPTAPSYGTPGPVGSTRYFAGGGGGSTDTPTSSTFAGGAGGGGTGGNPTTPGPERDGDTNTGGGGGSGTSSGTSNGGSGIVMIRYKFQN